MASAMKTCVCGRTDPSRGRRGPRVSCAGVAASTARPADTGSRRRAAGQCAHGCRIKRRRSASTTVAGLPRSAGDAAPDSRFINVQGADTGVATLEKPVQITDSRRGVSR